MRLRTPILLFVCLACARLGYGSSVLSVSALAGAPGLIGQSPESVCTPDIKVGVEGSDTRASSGCGSDLGNFSASADAGGTSSGPAITAFAFAHADGTLNFTTPDDLTLGVASATATSTNDVLFTVGATGLYGALMGLSASVGSCGPGVLAAGANGVVQFGADSFTRSADCSGGSGIDNRFQHVYNQGDVLLLHMAVTASVQVLASALTAPTADGSADASHTLLFYFTPLFEGGFYTTSDGLDYRDPALIGTPEPAPVPEPTTLVLAGTGLVAFCFRRAKGRT